MFNLHERLDPYMSLFKPYVLPKFGVPSKQEDSSRSNSMHTKLKWL